MKAIYLFKIFFKRFKAQFILSIGLLAIEFIFDLASIFSIAPVFDFLVNDNTNKMSPLTQKFIFIIQGFNLPIALYSFLGIFLGFQILKNGFFIFVRYSILKMKFEVVRSLLIGVLEDIFKARWLFFTGTGQGMILNTFNREMIMMGEAFYNMGLLLSGLLRLIVFISVPLYIAWHAAIVSLSLGLLFALPLLKLGPINYQLGRESTSTANHLMILINECLVSAKVVLGFGEQEKSINFIKDAYEENRKAVLKSQTLSLASPLFYEPLGIFAVFVNIMVAQNFGVPIAEIAVMIWAFMKAMPMIGHVVDRKNSLENLYPSYEQITQLQNKAKNQLQITGSRKFDSFKNEIRFENVTFSYPNHSPALIDISLNIPNGKMIGIVGESGAGKSTLADMIMGFNSPGEGLLTIDGTPLVDFDIISYRNRIGYVPQESILFDMTIRQNLLWVRETATDHEIWQACRQANADQFIRELPDQLDTIVGDRGIRLSGGQCQRISLARAILRDPDILIMDEATSSLDTQSERLIQQAIENIAKQTTVLVIAHRLSTIVQADYIYVMNKGRIIEQGTYNNLMKKNGSFTHMVNMQALHDNE